MAARRYELRAFGGVYEDHCPYDPQVPTISTFYGIAIRMYWREHVPPHFHAVYQGETVSIDITTLQTLRGWIPRRALSLTLEWAALHREELLEDWTLCQMAHTPKRIRPLE